MKILQIANHCRRSGNGIVNVAVDLSCFQASRNHEVTFASAKGEYVQLLADFGVHHFDVDQRSRYPAQLIKAIFQLSRILTTFKPDIVHAHMITGAVIAKMLKPFYGYRLVTTVHNEFEPIALIMGVGDRVIAVSDAVFHSLVSRGIPEHKIAVARNGAVGSPRRNGNIPSVQLCHPAIVCLAGMNHIKGIADLIDAFEIVSHRHAEAQLYLVGDGPQRAEFQALASSLSSAKRVHFVGFVEDPRGYLREADIFVLASRSESFGLAITEAREAGCAVVATNAGGIPEALDGGQAGVLVPPRDPDILASALGDLLNDPDQRAKLASRAREGLDKFSIARMGAEVENIYEAALRNIDVPNPRGDQRI
jgi:glycosyltransferase involved in cell wall biosynthesis